VKLATPETGMGLPPCSLTAVPLLEEVENDNPAVVSFLTVIWQTLLGGGGQPAACAMLAKAISAVDAKRAIIFFISVISL
jgi:hypothetical protein